MKELGGGVMASHLRSVLHRAAALTASGMLAVWCAACSGGTANTVTTSIPSGPGTTSTNFTSAIGGIALDCSNPIDKQSMVISPYQDILQTIGIQTRTTFQASPADETAPHRLFAKTPLLFHSGRTATLIVPKAWAKKVSLAWGTNAAAWTTTLQLPACPEPSGGGGPWLVYPGGFSLDQPACVPLEIATPTGKTTVRVPVGVPCPS